MDRGRHDELPNRCRAVGRGEGEARCEAGLAARGAGCAVPSPCAGRCAHHVQIADRHGRRGGRRGHRQRPGGRASCGVALSGGLLQAVAAAASDEHVSHRHQHDHRHRCCHRRAVHLRGGSGPEDARVLRRLLRAALVGGPGGGGGVHAGGGRQGARQEVPPHPLLLRPLPPRRSRRARGRVGRGPVERLRPGRGARDAHPADPFRVAREGEGGLARGRRLGLRRLRAHPAAAAPRPPAQDLQVGRAAAGSSSRGPAARRTCTPCTYTRVHPLMRMARAWHVHGR